MISKQRFAVKSSYDGADQSPHNHREVLTRVPIYAGRPPASIVVRLFRFSAAPAGPKVGTGADDNEIDGLAVAFGIDQPLPRARKRNVFAIAMPIRQRSGWRGGRVWLGFQP